MYVYWPCNPGYDCADCGARTGVTRRRNLGEKDERGMMHVTLPKATDEEWIDKVARAHAKGMLNFTLPAKHTFMIEARMFELKHGRKPDDDASKAITARILGHEVTNRIHTEGVEKHVRDNIAAYHERRRRRKLTEGRGV